MALIMQIHDPIHGDFEIPSYLEPLVLAPEVQRLAQVSLLNTPSPSFPALGEVRRFSHTLGVLRLALECPLGGFPLEVRKAFEASVLVHDIATPPYAHLFEYHLNEHEPNGWNHENMILDVLKGKYALEKDGHQIYAGRSIEFLETAARIGINLELVQAILSRSHPLSRLLFGTIDLDNLDNVVRMAWGLGIDGWQDIALRISSNLKVSTGGELLLSERLQGNDIKQWMHLRRQAYQILTYDESAIAAQAVLSDCLAELVSSGDLTKDDFDLTNSDMLNRLASHPITKSTMAWHFFKSLPKLVFWARIGQSESEISKYHRIEVSRIVQEQMDELFRKEKTFGYCILDNGMFEKPLMFNDPETGNTWTIGKRSSSVNLYGYISHYEQISSRKAHEAFDKVLSCFQCTMSNVEDYRVGFTAEVGDAQRTFTFSSP